MPAQVYYSTSEYLAFLSQVRPVDTHLGLANVKQLMLEGTLANSFNNS